MQWPSKPTAFQLKSTRVRLSVCVRVLRTHVHMPHLGTLFCCSNLQSQLRSRIQRQRGTNAVLGLLPQRRYRLACLRRL